MNSPTKRQMFGVVLIGLTLASTGYSQTAFIRPIVTEVESGPTILPTNPQVPVSALLQAKISTSPNGQFWACEVFVDAAGTTSEAAISGTRTGVTWAIARGETIPGLNVTIDSGTDERVLVNNAGDVSLSCNLTGSTGTDEAIIRWTRSSNTYAFTAREGSPIGVVPGENFGSDMIQRVLLSDGRLAFYNSGTSNLLPSSSDDFLFLSGAPSMPSPPSVIVQNSTLTPSGQSPVPPVAITGLEDEFWINADASQYIMTGFLNLTTTTEVAVVNGAVVLESGLSLPGVTGSFSTIRTVADVRMSPSGRWAAHGRADSGLGTPGAAYLVVDGQVIFSGDRPMPAGIDPEIVTSVVDIGFTTRGDVWFAAFTSLSRWVVVVVPNVPGAPALLAFDTINGTLDVNNDGDPSDDAAIVVSIFSAALADDGTLYLITRNNSPISAFNFDVIGYVPVSLPSACPADFNAQGGITVQDVFDFLAAWFSNLPAADFNGQSGVTVQDIFDFLAAWFAGCQ